MDFFNLFFFYKLGWKDWFSQTHLWWRRGLADGINQHTFVQEINNFRRVPCLPQSFHFFALLCWLCCAFIYEFAIKTSLRNLTLSGHDTSESRQRPWSQFGCPTNVEAAQIATRLKSAGVKQTVDVLRSVTRLIFLFKLTCLSSHIVFSISLTSYYFWRLACIFFLKYFSSQASHHHKIVNSKLPKL